MRTIAHISDLHFGAEDPPVVEGLLRDLRERNPSLVIISGDLTQRARRKQFRAAREYLKQIQYPQVVIPGNHDVPLYDFLRRFISPLGRYRHFIQRELNPWWVDDELAVLGLNTARSLTWKSGRISVDQMETISSHFCGVSDVCFKILVTHHPFIPPPGEAKAGVDLVGRAARALEVIDRCQVDILLAGHLHHGYSGDVRTHYPSTRRSIIVAQAGTATSHRVRDEPNGYNYITLDRDEIDIEVRKWTGTAFHESLRVVYRLHEEEWRPEVVGRGSS